VLLFWFPHSLPVEVLNITHLGWCCYSENVPLPWFPHSLLMKGVNITHLGWCRKNPQAFDWKRETWIQIDWLQ